MKFAKRFSVDQIIYAMHAYTDKHDDFPTPSNLVSILEPEKPKITQAEFIAAQKRQERNNDWSQYTPEAILIKDYHKQNDEKREVYEITCNKIKSLVGNTIKRIT